MNRALPCQHHTWDQKEIWGRKEVLRTVREMYDLILHLAWLHPKAVRHCVIVLAEAGLPWGKVDDSSASSPGQAWMAMGSNTSCSFGSGGTGQCFYWKPGRTVPATCLSWGMYPQKVQHCMLPTTRQWESWEAAGAAGQALPLHQSQERSQAPPYLPKRIYFLLLHRFSTPPTGLSKQPPPFQMLMLSSWLNCGPDHELGVNQYCLSMLIYTCWEFPFLHHLAELYDMSFISPHSLACHSPFLAPKPPALHWTPWRFTG